MLCRQTTAYWSFVKEGSYSRLHGFWGADGRRFIALSGRILFIACLLAEDGFAVLGVHQTHETQARL